MEPMQVQLKIAGTEILLTSKLGSNFTRDGYRRRSIKTVFAIFAIFTGKHLIQSFFFIKVAGLRSEKETLVQGFSCEFCKVFKSIVFTEHLWMNASILQQLLALYFAIIYSWQLISSERPLVGKNFNHMSRRDFTDLFYTDFFSFFF